MGWRDAVDKACRSTIAGDELADAIHAGEISPTDRIALARELLKGTGRVVARDVPAAIIPEHPLMQNVQAVGWNACRAAMLAPDDAGG
jgi:hypothetical protein